MWRRSHTWNLCAAAISSNLSLSKSGITDVRQIQKSSQATLPRWNPVIMCLKSSEKREESSLWNKCRWTRSCEPKALCPRAGVCWWDLVRHFGTATYSLLVLPCSGFESLPALWLRSGKQCPSNGTCHRCRELCAVAGLHFCRRGAL